MSKEEKKIKELEELGISLVEDPVNTINRANSAKLKLTALTFMAIAKIEMYFLEKMLKQAETAKDLANKNIASVNMSDVDKNAFLDQVDKNISILAKKVEDFKTNYSRLIAGSKRTLRVPENNTKRLFFRGSSIDKEAMVDVANAYKEINSIFSEAKSAFSAMAKPVKRDVEISAVEQDNIKNAVYQALNGIDEKNINDKNYQTAFSKVTDSAMKELEKTNIVNKEQKLDAFFNSGEIEMHTELDDNTLRNVLKEGKVVSTDKASSKAESPSDDSKTDNASAGVSRNDSLDGILQKGQVSIEPIKSVESIANFDEDDIFSGSTPIVTENKLEASSSSDKIEKSTDIFKSQNTDDLSDKVIGELTGKIVKNKTSIFDTDLKPVMTNSSDESASTDASTVIEEIIPDVEELRQQLNESVFEIEQNRVNKEKAKEQYNKEKSTRELKQKELSQSKQEVEDIKQDIERKEKEQQSIGKLKNDIEVALKLKKQIEENKRQAAQEAEETRKYQESLKEEQQKRAKVDAEKQGILEEKNRLSAENFKVSSNLQTEKEKLEDLKRELQSFNSESKATKIAEESNTSSSKPIKR
jgi:hypothetical protein